MTIKNGKCFRFKYLSQSFALDNKSKNKQIKKIYIKNYGINHFNKFGKKNTRREDRKFEENKKELYKM